MIGKTLEAGLAGKSQSKVVLSANRNRPRREGGKAEGKKEGMRKLGESADSEVGSGSIGFFSNGYASLRMTKGNQNWKREGWRERTV